MSNTLCLATGAQIRGRHYGSGSEGGLANSPGSRRWPNVAPAWSAEGEIYEEGTEEKPAKRERVAEGGERRAGKGGERQQRVFPPNRWCVPASVYQGATAGAGFSSGGVVSVAASSDVGFAAKNGLDVVAAALMSRHTATTCHGSVGIQRFLRVLECFFVLCGGGGGGRWLRVVIFFFRCRLLSFCVIQQYRCWVTLVCFEVSLVSRHKL